jgi:hypothetical protein
MRRTLRSRQVLAEESAGQCSMNPGETRWLGSQVNNHVYVVRRANICGMPFNLVKEDHLSTDEQPIAPERRRQLDECRPRFNLAANQWR